jgi:hypothetical protein
MINYFDAWPDSQKPPLQYHRQNRLLRPIFMLIAYKMRNFGIVSCIGWG